MSDQIPEEFAFLVAGKKVSHIKGGVYTVESRPTWSEAFRKWYCFVEEVTDALSDERAEGPA